MTVACQRSGTCLVWQFSPISPLPGDTLPCVPGTKLTKEETRHGRQTPDAT